MNKQKEAILREESDETLCRRASTGDGEAETELLQRYHRFVRSCARPLFLAGGDSEDLIQEGMLGLLSAIREYRPEKAVSFRTFAETCIRNRLYSALRTAGCEKHTPLNSALPLDASFETIPSFFPDLPAFLQNPEEQIISQDFVERFLCTMRQQLSPMEQTILDAYLNGFSCREIAEQTGRPYKTVDNAIQRVRRKLIRLLSMGDLSKS